MNNKTVFAIITIAVVTVVTYLIRALAFIVFPANKPSPNAVKRLSMTLPYGIMGLLVVYCLKDTNVTAFPYGIYAFASVLIVILLQAWRKNSLLSVLIGTVCYMILIRVM